MKRIFCATAISLVSLAAVAGPGAAPVNVTNTPLPVTGTVSVSGTPTVTVANPVVPVEVSNAEPIPVVDSKANTPYAITVGYDRDQCYGSNCTNYVHEEGSNCLGFNLPAVPAGKRWVLTYLSGTVPYEGATITTLELYEGSYLKMGHYGPYFGGFGESGFSAQTFVTFGPAVAPKIYMCADVYPLRYQSWIAFSGYLIDEAQ